MILISRVMKIFIANVSFDEQPNTTKRRPALVVAYNNQYVTAFKITSKFGSKSRSIQSTYFPIFEWKKAGLYKASYVDTHKLYQISANAVFKRPPIGELTSNDVARLKLFIQKPTNISDES